MEFYLIESEGFLFLFSFILSLLTAYYLYGIIKRTTHTLKQGIILLLISLLIFCFTMALEVFYRFQVLRLPVVIAAGYILFIVFFLFAIYRLREIIKDLADYGQILLLVSEETHIQKIQHLLQEAETTCYMYLGVSKPSDRLITMVNEKAFCVITTNAVFKTSVTTLLSSIDVKELQTVLSRLLSEHRFTSVIIDDIANIPNIQPHELPYIIQEIRSILKQHGVRGYFLIDKQQLDYSIIEDISLIVDRVER